MREGREGEVEREGEGWKERGKWGRGVRGEKRREGGVKRGKKKKG